MRKGRGQVVHALDSSVVAGLMALDSDFAAEAAVHCVDYSVRDSSYAYSIKL